MKRNEFYETISCFLLVIMTALSFTYRSEEIKSFLFLFTGIAVFCIITCFSIKSVDTVCYGLIKCECMIFCLLMMISMLMDVNLSVVLILTLLILLATTFREIRKHT